MSLKRKPQKQAIDFFNKKRNTLNKITNCLVFLLSVIVLFSVLGNVEIDYWREMLLFIVYGVLTEALVVSLPYGQLSMRFVVVVSSFMAFGGSAAVWISWLFCLLGRGIFNKGNSWINTILYSSYCALAVYTGALFYQLIGGSIVPEITLANCLRMLVFLIGYFIVANLLGSAMLSGQKDQALFKNQWLSLLKIDLFSFIVTVPLGMLTFYVYSSVGIKATILLFIPILAVQYLISLAERLESANRELAVVYKIARRLNDQVELGKIMPEILTDIKELVPYHYAIVYIWSEEKMAYIPMTVDMPVEDKQFTVPMIYSNKDVLWSIIENGAPEIVHNTKNDIRFQNRQGICQICSSLMLVPWKVRGQNYGMIALGYKKAFYYQNSHQKNMELLISEISIVVANHVLAEKLNIIDKLDSSGALNMDTFLIYAGKQLRSSLGKKKSGAVFYINIKFFDEFKQKNNYLVAEELMKTVVKFLSEIIKIPFFLARYGNGQFVMFVDNIREEKARDMAYNLKSAIAMNKFRIRRYDLEAHLTVEIGKSFYPKNGENILALVQEAEADITKKKKIYLNLNSKV